MRISWVLLYEYLPTVNGLSVKQEERNMILATGSASGSGSMVMMIVWLAVMFAIMYFLMVRPQKKEQKRLSAMINSMEVGDAVVTTSGFYGIVIDITEEDVVVEFGIRFQHIELPFFFVYEDDVIVRVCRLSVAQHAECAAFAHASLPRKYHNDFFA